ncbi:hypothetical protein E2562_018671 [Oryza meyeriana var. granulata]|uniref:Uncharacterized protein n=1 Tax=Oryza meyeriana var. granulata TaxID=110450 RepID=A0A6G1BXZ8_9ORYZ|nr:hypothetical protein E2562_018671 [Oryza meyeriana var. granulata]
MALPMAVSSLDFLMQDASPSTAVVPLSMDVEQPSTLTIARSLADVEQLPFSVAATAYEVEQPLPSIYQFPSWSSSHPRPTD